MLQVRHFSWYGENAGQTLAENINQWLCEEGTMIEVVDIKYAAIAVQGDYGTTEYSALVIYRPL